MNIRTLPGYPKPGDTIDPDAYSVEVIGTFDVIPAMAWLGDDYPLGEDPDGYCANETDVWWDDQRTVRYEGLPVLVVQFWLDDKYPLHNPGPGYRRARTLAYYDHASGAFVVLPWPEIRAVFPAPTEGE